MEHATFGAKGAMKADPADLARTVLTLVKAGEVDQALKPSEDLIEATSPGERLRLVAVQPFAQAGMVDRAAELCDEVAEAEPGEKQPLRLKAQLAAGAGRDDLLAQALSALLSQVKTTLDLNWIAEHVEAAGWSDRPTHELQSLLVAGGQAEPPISFALLLVMLDQPEAAKPFLTRAMTGLPNNPDLLTAAAIAHAATGDNKQAQALTGKALAIRPFVRSPTEGGEASLMIVVDLVRGHFTRNHRALGPRAYASGNFPSEIRPGRLDVHNLHLQSSGIDRVIGLLPPIDVVLANLTWGGAEPGAEIIERYDALLAQLNAVALNHPRDHIAMSREANYRRWADAPEFLFPKTVRMTWDGRSIETVAGEIEASFDYPVILRPTITQVGAGMVLAKTRAELLENLKGLSQRNPFYAVQYHETVSDGGYHRKYRAAVIDGELIPFRIDARQDWMVHRTRGGLDYTAPAAVVEEEKALQRDYRATLKSEAIATLERIAADAPLDVFGIDFGYTTDGRVIVFEANAMMNLIPHRAAQNYPYYAPMAERIQAAVEDAVIRRKR